MKRLVQPAECKPKSLQLVNYKDTIRQFRKWVSQNMYYSS